jgi:hypothetical protein
MGGGETMLDIDRAKWDLEEAMPICCRPGPDIEK